MATVSGKDLGEALCKAVGIDPEGVGKVSILLNDDAKIVVEKVIDVDDAGALIAAIRAIKRDAVK